MVKYKKMRVFLNNQSKRRLKRRQVLATMLLIIGFLLLIIISRWVHWPPRYVAYMESDPINQPFPGVYAVVSYAPMGFSQKKINRHEAKYLAKRLGYSYWIMLDYKENIKFSLDLLDAWPVENEIIALDFATRPISDRESYYGVMGVYYFFNEMNSSIIEYFEQEYPTMGSISKERVSSTGKKVAKSTEDNSVPVIAKHHKSEGMHNLLVWDSALTTHQRRTPYSTVLHIAQHFSQAQGYDGFILLSYRYIREYQLDFDFYPIKRSHVQESLRALEDLGYEYYINDIVFFR